MYKIIFKKFTIIARKAKFVHKSNIAIEIRIDVARTQNQKKTNGVNSLNIVNEKTMRTKINIVIKYFLTLIIINY